MLIDWFTVVAQIFNFLVLVALLKRVLWGKLVHAIDEREARVAGDLAKAEEKYKEAEVQREQLRVQAEEWARKRGDMLAQARKEAEAERAKLIQEARESAEAVERKWREDLDREHASFFAEFKSRAGAEIFTVVRQALADLSSSHLQQSVIEVFLEKLQSIDVAVLRELGSKEHVVRSAVDLPGETQQRIKKVLQARLGTLPPMRFERDASMNWGIELCGDGQRIGWNPDSYLGSLEENLKEYLYRRTEALDRQAVEFKER